MLLILYIPNVFSLVLHCFWGRQTLHYLWAKKELGAVHILVNEMCQQNGKPLISMGDI